MSVTRINHFQAAAGCEASLQEFLREVLTVIRSAVGCEHVELLVAQEDPAQLVIVERWASIAAHQQAASLIPQEQLARVRPLLAGPPRGTYYDPA